MTKTKGWRGGKNGNAEGSVHEQVERRTRKDGSVVERTRWVAAVTTEDGKRKRFYAKTRQEADKKLTAAKSDLHRGLPLPNQQITVAAFLTKSATR